ncbi:ATP-binding protein (plasmid) [Lactococcus garvieae]|uniref:ATP-binding protein n=1 Tax=Lactococcus garvieae TaxID=1363 RepID=UPI00311B1900
MKIENLLLNEGNISVIGNPGTGKTSLLRLVVENALSLNIYDEIIIYARFKGEEYDELLKNKKVKLGKFLAPSLISQFFDGVELFPSKKQRLVIVDDFEEMLYENIHNKNVRKYRAHLQDLLYKNMCQGIESPMEIQRVYEKNDLDLSRYMMEKKLCSYNDRYIDAKPKYCISSSKNLDDLPFKFLQRIQFSRLNRGFPLGHFEYTSTHKLNDYLEASKEDYWGNY